MKRASMAFILLASIAVWAAECTTWAQDFQKNYGIPAGGQIRIGNVSGDVKVTGGRNISSVFVNAYKAGRDRDLVPQPAVDLDHARTAFQAAGRGPAGRDQRQADYARDGIFKQ